MLHSRSIVFCHPSRSFSMSMFLHTTVVVSWMSSLRGWIAASRIFELILWSSPTMVQSSGQFLLPSRLHLFLLLGRFVAGKSWTMMLFVRLYSLVRSASLQLIQLYNETLIITLDKFIPLHWVKSRVSCFTPWFDERRSTKRTVRLLERRCRRTRLDRDKLAWITGLRDQHRFFKEKESSYWEHIVNSIASDSKKLWRSVSTMLGKPAKQQSSLPPFSAPDFLAFLEKKWMSFVLQPLVHHLQYFHTLIATLIRLRFALRLWLNEQSRLIPQSAVS